MVVNGRWVDMDGMRAFIADQWVISTGLADFDDKSKGPDYYYMKEWDDDSWSSWAVFLAGCGSWEGV